MRAAIRMRVIRLTIPSNLLHLLHTNMTIYTHIRAKQNGDARFLGIVTVILGDNACHDKLGQASDPTLRAFLF